MYHLQKKDIEQASECLALAFQDYPVFTYIIPDSPERKRKMKYLCRFIINMGFLRGQITANSESIEGVSVCYPPDGINISFFDIIRSGIFILFFRLSLRSFIWLMFIKKNKNKVRNQLLKGKKYFFLDIIGVNPLSQAKGIASAIIKSKITESDHLQVPIYLETSDSKNVTYYEKFGFSVLKAYKINKLEVFCMIRQYNTF